MTLVLGAVVYLPWQIWNGLNPDNTMVKLLFSTLFGWAIVAAVIGGLPGVLCWYVTPIRRAVYEIIVLMWQKDRHRFGMDRNSFIAAWVVLGVVAVLFCGFQIDFQYGEDGPRDIPEWS